MKINATDLLSGLSLSKVKDLAQEFRNRYEWYGNNKDKQIHDELISYLKITWDEDFETIYIQY